MGRGTKSGNRLQFGDDPGKESVTLATPNSSSIMMSESSDTTSGRTLITLQSFGDIILTAPNGRVHIKSKFFSREIG